MVNSYRRKRIISLSKKPELSLRDIAKRVGVSHETVRRVLIGVGNHNEWLAAREEYEAMKKQNGVDSKNGMIERLVNAMFRLCVGRARREDLALCKTLVLFHSRHKPLCLEFDVVYNLLRDYYKARASPEKPTLSELGAPYGLPFHRVSKLLRAVNERAYYSRESPRCLSVYEKKRVVAACLADTGLSLADRSLLLGYPPHIVRAYARRLGLSCFSYQPLRPKGSKHPFSYVQALELYGAFDLGFSLEDIVCLFEGVREKEVNALLSVRPMVELEVKRFRDFVKLVDLMDALELGYTPAQAMFLASVTAELYTSLINKREELQEAYSRLDIR
ncbi:hypothetical protein DRJ48_02870 [Candidatus Woesearchaeota archaeon]|nr:MAG: hypothetical protein DRJ48_02870 [Candidatus Woesearchaeota archaeon]